MSRTPLPLANYLARHHPGEWASNIDPALINIDPSAIIGGPYNTAALDSQPSQHQYQHFQTVAPHDTYTGTIRPQDTQTQLLQPQTQPQGNHYLDIGMHDQGICSGATGADESIAGPGPDPEYGAGAGPGPEFAISTATAGSAGQVTRFGHRQEIGMSDVAASNGVGHRMLIGQIYDAVQNEYTPVLAPEITASNQLIAVEMHSVINGMLYRHQDFTVDARSCCTFMGVIHTLMNLYPEVNIQCKVFALIDISGQYSIFNPLQGAWEIFWQMGSWGKVSAFAAPHDEEDDFRARGRRLIIIMGR
ncbi:hypothetical protein BZA77DRAFT_297910 [Pyronema omphalodes]|nr:hypothetical protein BZA77DRAFT_297910 [Pyronema omphalodes]